MGQGESHRSEPGWGSRRSEEQELREQRELLREQRKVWKERQRVQRAMADMAPGNLPAPLAAPGAMVGQQWPQDQRFAMEQALSPLEFHLAALRTAGLVSVGLIGSTGKWSRFRGTLLSDGHAAAAVDGIRTPIGLPELTGKDPAVIAVSVAAALHLQWQHRLERSAADPGTRA